MYRPYFCPPGGPRWGPKDPASPWSQGYIGPAVTPPTQSCVFDVRYISTFSTLSSTITLSSFTSTTTLVNCVQTSPLLPNPCYLYPQPPTQVANSPCVKPITTRNYVTNSESQRILAQQQPSTFLYQEEVTILPGGYDVPLVTIQNTPASITTQKLQTATLAAANNPYNPDPAIRFARYFPAQPPGIPCEPRIAVPGYGLRNYPQYGNNGPQAIIGVCVPNTRFSGINPSAPSTIVAPLPILRRTALSQNVEPM